MRATRALENAVQISSSVQPAGLSWSKPRGHRSNFPGDSADNSVTLLYFDGCPNWTSDRRLSQLATDATWVPLHDVDDQALEAD